MFIDQSRARQLDEALIAHGHSIEQLMELAGLAVAQAVARYYPERKNVLVICGPGNNGGDGLVAARHLASFGFQVSVCYPKKSKGDLFERLLQQLGSWKIDMVDEFKGSYDLIVDAIFGFSFRGPIRPPFDQIIQDLKDLRAPIVSVDIPSGWVVDHGPDEDSLQPEMLISLTLPKRCAEKFNGIHILAGRFLSPLLSGIDLPWTSPNETFMELQQLKGPQK